MLNWKQGHVGTLAHKDASKMVKRCNIIRTWGDLEVTNSFIVFSCYRDKIKY